MNLSPKGLDLLKTLESFVAFPYDDATGKPVPAGKSPKGTLTIGFGHAIKKGEHFTEVTLDEANRLLKDDLAIYERIINRLFPSGLTQNQYDALVLFCFNTGGGEEFLNSNVVKYIKLKEYDMAFIYWRRWIHEMKDGKLVKSEGLVNRREAEIALFLGKNNESMAA